jgi:hypothetical protein
MLSNIHHRKAVLAYSAIFRDNFDPELATIGLGTKALPGLMFAKSVDNQTLVDESQHLALLHARRENIPILASTLDEVAKICQRGQTEYQRRGSSIDGPSTVTNYRAFLPKKRQHLTLVATDQQLSRPSLDKTRHACSSQTNGWRR